MLSDNRYKQLMEQVGMPNSRSLLQALQQATAEAAQLEREKIIKNATGSQQPNEQLFQLIAVEVEQEYRMGGLSSGLYFDFALDCLRHYMIAVGGIPNA